MGKKKILGGLSRIIMPPAENSRLTQIATTGGTYEKARDLLDAKGATRRIDYGSGRGHGANIIGGDSFEPYAPPDFTPTYNRSADIPSDAYDGLTNLNVLNVLDPRARDEAVDEMGRIMRSGGTGLITTRGRDVMSAKGTPGAEDMSLIIGEGDRARYQKGFRQDELLEYLHKRLGRSFNVDSLPLGAAGARVDKKARGGLAHLKRGGQPPEFPANQGDLDALKNYSIELSRDGFKKRFGHSTSDVNSMTHWDGAAAPDPTAPTPMSPMAVKIMGERYQAPFNAPKAVSDLVEGGSEFVIPQDALDAGLYVAGLPGKIVGKGAKAAAAGLGYALSSDDAEAGIGGLRKASMFPIGKHFQKIEGWEKRLLEGEPMGLWADEGVYKGKDGLWRFEYDDSGSKIKDLPTKGAPERPLGAYLDHDEAYNEYPFLRDLPVRYAPDGTNRGGFYMPPGHSGQSEGITASKKIYSEDPEAFRSLLLHEMQHGIQNREGFVPGANAAWAGTEMRLDILNASNGVKDDAFAPRDLDEIEVAQAMKSAIDKMPKGSRDFMDYQAYLRNYGEIEARNVQRRKDLSPADRRKHDNIPEYTTDIETKWGAIIPGRGFEANGDAYEHVVRDVLREKQRQKDLKEGVLPDLSDLKFAEGGGVETDDDIIEALASLGADPATIEALTALGAS